MKKSNITYYIIPLLIFLLIYLSYYPGLISYDGNTQWQQVQSGLIDNAHPFFSTYFMFLLSKIWNNLSIIVLYQILLISISWGYFCQTINPQKKKDSIIICVFSVFVMFLPLTSLYSITIWKDIIYTYYLFTCCTLLYKWAINNYNFNKFKYILLGLLIALVFSYRHNGIIVAILLLIIFYYLLIKKNKGNITEIKKGLAVFITFITVILVILVPKKMFLEKSRIQDGTELANSANSLSTIDGYMLWMMGAHIKDENIKEEQDLDFLNNIIPLEEWKIVYSPYLINNTNLSDNLDKHFLVNNKEKFEHLFVKYSLNYPLTIIKHYLKADALLINPVSSINGYVYVFCFPELEYLPKYAEIKSKLPSVKKHYDVIFDLSFKKPFIIFYQPAFILYLSITLTVILSKKVCGKKIWIFVLPMIVNSISLLPINLAQDLRYVYINYLTFFGLLLLLFVNYDKLLKKKK